MEHENERVQSPELNALTDEVNELFRAANNHRNSTGITPCLQKGCIRESMSDSEDGVSDFISLNINNSTDCNCDVTKDETCDVCETELLEVCDSDDLKNLCKDQSPYSNLANLLATVKKYEYISLAENAYAQIGNKPFRFKATKTSDSNPEEMEEVRGEFYKYLQNFLDVNQVRIHELPEAFDLGTLGEVSNALAEDAQSKATIRLRSSINKEELVMEKVFKRSDFMAKYLEVIRDTTEYPIGVMWADDKSIKKQKVIEKGVMKFKKVMQCDVERINPCYFWATEDHLVNSPGTAVFKLTQYTSGDFQAWIDKGVVEGDNFKNQIKWLLDEHEDGFRDDEAMLFSNHMLLKKGMYDVIVGRGYFSRASLEEQKIDVPKEYDNETYIPCEVYMCNHHVIRARVMPCVDENLGVYTISFRRKGQSIFGYSLHDFIDPFTRMYQAMVDGIDRNMGKTTGSIIQLDRGVIQDPDKYLNRNEKTGDMELDFSEDWVVEFDSSDVFNPNFKGLPIHVTQLPNNLGTMLPLRDFIMRELEHLSGIPNILVNGANVSSALRTTKNFNAAFTASAKVIKSLLREPERRILKPAIQFFFDTKAQSGDMKDFLIDAEPEILLSDTLTRENNDDRELVQNVSQLIQLGGGLIPQEKVAALVNMVAREVYDLNDELIDGVGVLDTNSSAEVVGPV